MSVYFSSRNACVTEELFQCQHVSVAVLIHKCSSGVAELMSCYAFTVETCLLKSVFNDLLDAAFGYTLILIAYKERRLGSSFRICTAYFKIAVQRSNAGIVKLHHTFLVSFTEVF